MLRLRNVTKVFPDGPGTLAAIEGIDLAVASGTLLAVMGPSGSGKTTLALIAAAVEHPIRGEVWLDDRDIARSAQPSERGYGAAPSASFSSMTSSTRCSSRARERRAALATRRHPARRGSRPRMQRFPSAASRSFVAPPGATQRRSAPTSCAGPGDRWRKAIDRRRRANGCRRHRDNGALDRRAARKSCPQRPSSADDDARLATRRLCRRRHVSPRRHQSGPTPMTVDCSR